MLHRFHDRFGTAGVLIAVIALVAALGGTALAAGGLTSQQEKQVKKIAKKFAGKPGAAGANGTNGSPGAKGDPGAAGTNGTNGTNGTAGTNGKSVVLTAEAKGANCEEGGTKVEVEGNAASKKYVCNGSPWTAGGTLPSGKTETGIFVYDESNLTSNHEVRVPISFPIPLPVSSEEAYFLNVGETEAVEETEEPGAGGCAGSVEHPTAPPGVLCVYTHREIREHVEFLFCNISEYFGYMPSGTSLYFFTTEGSARLAVEGSWAVTAP